MPRKAISKDLKKEPITVAVPGWIHKQLKNAPNKSKIVTQILEENATRILDMNVERAADLKNKIIRDKVLEELRAQKVILAKTITSTEGIVKLLDNLKELRKNFTSLKREVRESEQELSALVTDLRRTTSDSEASLREKIEKIIKELQDVPRLQDE